jgi:farnesyl-diphosphate farnesyltransferase
MDWDLLRAVSRSFYLTIRVLPRPVRDAVSLGYLLARASDSIADTSRAPVERRAQALRDLQRGDVAAHVLEEMVKCQALPAEAALISRLPELIERLEASRQRALIEWVWGRILSGQLFDLVRFGESQDPLSADELDEYTYLVAGVVGDFWTRLCAQAAPGFSHAPLDRLVDLGVRYGKGLQLVNILRDRRADAALGRVYVPDGRFRVVKSEAESGLRAGLEWASLVNNGRIRFACLPPARIGLRTLEKIEIDSGPVKITRGEVREVVVGAVPALWFRSR